MGVVNQFLLEYKDIFSDQVKPFYEYLEPLNKKQLIDVGVFLLSFNSPSSIYDSPQKLLGMWFSKENHNLKTAVLGAINALERKHGRECKIASPICVLSIFEYAFQKKTAGTKLDNKSFEEQLLKAVLAFNQEFTQRDNKVLTSISHIAEGDRMRLPALTLSTAMINSDISNYVISDLLIAQFVKACYLFEFLEKEPQTQPHLLEFLKFYNVSSWKEYLRMYLPLAFSCFKKKREAHLDIEIPQTNPDYNKICNFVEKLTLQNSQTLSKTDFLTLRDKPLYKISRGTYRVIFTPFLMEKIFQSLYFTLSSINSSLPKGQKVNREFRGFYGEEFSEKYLVYEILGKCFPKKFLKITGEQMRLAGMEGEPDYYVRNNNKIFLFEAKDTLLNAKTKHSDNFKDLETALLEKFYRNKKGKPKAILQLIDNIRSIIERNFSVDKIDEKKKLKIYPILLLHYPQYNTPGLNRIVNSWFQDELDKLAAEGLDISGVRSLVIIDLDTFILHQELLLSRQSKFLLEKTLDDYSKLMDGKTNRLISFKWQFYRLIDNSLLSFPFYFSGLVDKKRGRKTPRVLKDKGIKLFK